MSGRDRTAIPSTSSTCPASTKAKLWSFPFVGADPFVVAEASAPFRSKKQRSHLPAVLAHQVFVLDHAERIDQGLLRQPLFVTAVAAQHFQELLQRRLRLASHQLLHAQQVAG